MNVFAGRIRASFVLGVVSALCATGAQAETAVCVGPVTTLANHANGNNGLHVVIGNGPIIRVCSFNSTQFTVTPDDCKHMASLAATAFATGAIVTFYVDNAPSNQCSSIANWHSANTRYFALNQP
jgi:hypothetical protein